MTPQGATAEAGALRRARTAVATGFLLFGVGTGVWFVHIPLVSARLALSPGLLGLGLFASGLVSLLAQPAAAALVARIGSRRATRILLPLGLATFPLPVLAASVPAFLTALLWLGLMIGSLNVAINTQAVEIETARGRPTMSLFHGFFSLGGLIAAGLGGAMIAAGLGDGLGALGLATMAVGVGLWAGRGLLPPGQTTAATGPRRLRFTLPGGALLGLAGLAFLCNSVEGAVTNWSALFLVGAKGATASAAALGYAFYSLAMALGRFGGGRAVARIGERRMVIVGGALVAAGSALAILAASPLVSATGFLVLGFGAANGVPVLIGAASRVPGIPAATGVAAAMSGATVGYLAAPPVVGAIAQGLGLTAALGVVTAAGLTVAVTATLRHWPSVRTATA